MARPVSLSRIGLKSQICPSPPLNLVPARGDQFRSYGKALRNLKLVFQAADGEDLVILACTVFD